MTSIIQAIGPSSDVLCSTKCIYFGMEHRRSKRIEVLQRIARMYSASCCRRNASIQAFQQQQFTLLDKLQLVRAFENISCDTNKDTNNFQLIPNHCLCFKSEELKLWLERISTLFISISLKVMSFVKWTFASVGNSSFKLNVLF